MNIFDLKPVCKVEPVNVGGNTFFIKYLTALERDQFEHLWVNHRNENSVVGIRSFITVFCLADKDGNLLNPAGDKDKPSDEFIKAFNHANLLCSDEITPLADAAIRINKFGANDLEELEGN